MRFSTLAATLLLLLLVVVVVAPVMVCVEGGQSRRITHCITVLVTHAQRSQPGLACTSRPLTTGHDTNAL